MTGFDVALAVLRQRSGSLRPVGSNLKNWNFGINAIFFNADKDLRGSSETSKLEFRM